MVSATKWYAIIGVLIILTAAEARAVPVNFEVIFTQTFFHPNFGARPLTGSFSLDSGAFGVGFENTAYDPGETLLTEFFATPLTGDAYLFDRTGTNALVNTPEILLTGPVGEVINIQGLLSKPSGFPPNDGPPRNNTLLLGGDAGAGQYVEVVFSSAFTANPVSRGVYTVSLATLSEDNPTAVPTPDTFMLFGFGLAAIGFFWCDRRVRNSARTSL